MNEKETKSPTKQDVRPGLGAAIRKAWESLTLRVQAFVDWLWSIHAKSWLTALLIILAIPLIANTFLPRYTVFRIVAETQTISATLRPSELFHSVSVNTTNGLLCSDSIRGEDSSDEDLCPGFNYAVPVPSGTLTFLKDSHLNATHIDGRTIKLTITPLDPRPIGDCDAPVLQIEKGGDAKIQGADIGGILFDGDEQALAFSCGTTRFVYESKPSERNDWIILDGVDITFGTDIGPTASAQTASILSGEIEIHGFGFFSDLIRLIRSTLAPQHGYIGLGSFKLNFADAVRFKGRAGTKTIFSASALATERGFIVSAWIIASEAVVSTYGSPGYVLRASPIDRLLNDPLLNYWSAITLTFLTLWLRATMMERLFSRSMNEPEDDSRRIASPE